MELAAFAETHGAFFVPAFAVYVGTESLTTQLATGVSQVEVDLTLSALGRFSFSVVNTFDLKRGAFLSGDGTRVLDVLSFGAPITVKGGYGSHADLPPLITGTVTEISTGFSEGGAPELTVAGYDNLFPMTLGKRSQNWKDARDSDVVSALAGEYNLPADIETTTERHPQIEQNQESDFEFVKKLAGRNHFEFYVDPEGTLRFGRPRDREAGIVTLRWGESLLSFKPEANLAAQVSQVEVYGWDDKKKKAIVGKAVAGEESGRDPRCQSAGEQLRAAVGKAPVLQIRLPVLSEAEAKDRAKAILNDHAKRFLTGEAECIGLPELLPDHNITLENLGEPFSKTYYINQTTHKFDGNAYRTRVKVKETSLCLSPSSQ